MPPFIDSHTVRIRRLRPPRLTPGLLIGVLTGALLAGGVALALHGMAAHQARERQASASSLAATLARALENTLLSGGGIAAVDNARFQRLVGAAARGWPVDYAMVVSPQGTILAHTNAALVGREVSEGPGAEAAAIGCPLSANLATPGHAGAKPTSGQVSEYAAPLVGPDGAQGAVVLGVDAAGPAASFADVSALLLPALAICLMIPLTYSVVRFSVRPLLDTGRELRSLLEGQQVAGLPMVADGEIGTMVRGVRDLMRELGKIFQAQEEKRRAAEAEARVHDFENRRLRAVVERLTDGVVIEGPDGRIEMVNPAAERILAVDRKTLLRRDAAAEPGLLPSPPGGRPTMAVSAVPLTDSARNHLGTLHLIRDHAGQRMVEQSHHQFVSHVAHEVKNPLNTIRSYTEMLVEGDAGDRETRKEFVNTINEEASRLARLIDNLLSLSRIEIGMLRLERQFVKGQNVIQNAVQAVAQQARGKGVDLQVRLPDRMGNLSGDRELLQVALVNLLNNAVKYTAAGGRVTLTAEERDGRLAVQVADTGPGIPPEDQARVFEKFFRSSSPALAGVPGHGLGLPLAREIARLHGGEIHLESEPGRGTTFTLELPAETGAREASPAAASAPARSGEPVALEA